MYEHELIDEQKMIGFIQVQFMLSSQALSNKMHRILCIYCIILSLGEGGEGCISLSSKIPIFQFNILKPRDTVQLSEQLFAATVGGNQSNASLRS